MMVGVVILAAGASSRMGEPKQLLEFDGRSFLRRAATEALRSACRPIVVVVGANAAQVRAEVSGLEVLVVENPWWAAGMSRSLRAGVAELVKHDGVGAVLVMLCDQPFVTAAVVGDLVAAYRSTGKTIVASEYGGSCGVPALFARTHFAELIALDDAGGAKGMIAAHAAEVTRLSFPKGEVDIDTPEDYRRLRGEAVAEASADV